jgi:hypothetical protein
MITSNSSGPHKFTHSNSVHQTGKSKKMCFILCKIEIHIYMNIIIVILYVYLTVLMYISYILLHFYVHRIIVSEVAQYKSFDELMIRHLFY